MKKSINLLVLLVIIISSSIFIGCNENPVNTSSSTDVVLESGLQSEEEAVDFLITDSERQTMKQNFLYVSFGGPEYQAGAVFYRDNDGQLHSDIPSVAKNVRVFVTADSIVVKFEYLGHQVVLRAYLIKIKYQQLPVRDSLHAFNGLGIVKERKLAFVYNEQAGKIIIFDKRDNIIERLSAQRVDNVVYISSSRELRPNEVVPDPWQSNVHRFIDRMANFESYLPTIQ